MKKISRDDIGHVAEGWLRAYKNTKGSLETYALLLEATNADEIEAILGNKEWTEVRCDCCGDSVLEGVMLSVDIVCKACLKDAMGLL